MSDDIVTPEEMTIGEIVAAGRLRRIRHKLLREPVSEDTEMMIEHPAEWRWQKMHEARKKS